MSKPQGNPDEYLTLRPGWQPVALCGDAVILTSEDRACRIEGPQALSVVTALISGLSRSEVTRLDAADLIERLRVAGAIADARPHHDRPAAAFWDLVEGAPGTIAWRALSPGGVAPLQSALDQNKVKINEDSPVVLVTADDYLHPDLPELARTESRPWLIARPSGRSILLGPLFRRDQTLCWFCLAHWLKTQRWLTAATTGWDSDACPPQPAIAALPGTYALAAGWIANTMAVLSATGALPALENTIQSIDTLGWGVATHSFSQRPNCPQCQPISRLPKGRTHLMDWTDPLTGIAHKIRVTAEPRGGFFHAACEYYRPLPVRGARGLLNPGVAHGRGADRRVAETGCVAEALERYSAVWQGNETVSRGTIDEVGGLHPDAMLHFGKRQYVLRAEAEKRYGRDHPGWVPAPFDPRSVTDWVQANCLGGGAPIMLPAALCYLWYPLDDALRFGVPNSNGVGAGDCREAAILSALLEVVERDAVAIWWYNRLRRPEVSPALFKSKLLNDACAELKTVGVHATVLDITTDVGIPTFVAVGSTDDGRSPFLGSAANPDPVRAAESALGEMSQLWFWTMHDGPPLLLEHWLREATLDSEPYLRPTHETAPPIGVSRGLDACVERLRACRLDAYAVDLTRPEIGVPVFRVVIPAMRHCWRRLGQGRLYDVPLTLGWVETPVSEADLNHWLCPI